MGKSIKAHEEKDDIVEKERESFYQEKHKSSFQILKK